MGNWKEPLLTIGSVAARPDAATTCFASRTGEQIVFRPLLPIDAPQLAKFLEGLSPRTRVFSTYPGYDLAAAQGLCNAINRYDKLRFVAMAGSHVVALLEFSLSITEANRQAYQGYGIELNERTDIRFGLCIADGWQDRGLGSDLMPYLIDVARRLGKQRMILWGGVLVENSRAIHFYEKIGFRLLGRFTNGDGKDCRDGILIL